ncbi:EID1-like F-box protein 3 [Sesamum angolense]|uniref:EID1-like F-box protein 3 n=1 Tax=Sesamum angolense TaxID=2727404 RepID=A0AAE1X896_9LAMI|nr:EID1-like F-box protein 3 [Sesamum angolense]
MCPKMGMGMGMGESESSSQMPRLNESPDSGILNERVLILVFESLNWDIHTLCRTAAVNRRLRALAKRLLWRELCLYRAPRMMSTLTEGSQSSRMIGGWNALAKLLFFCGGCESTRHFRLSQPSPGHFVESSRFSKTSGRSFLAKNCRGDVLYVSDPCEHPTGDKQDDVGIYRGVFRAFMKSRTREFLIRRQVEFEAGVKCPYCGARVWSMTAARLIPRKSAARRLGSKDGALEYFVCLNGHLHGTCWLVPLSSDEEAEEEDDDDGDIVGSDDEEYDEDADGGSCNNYGDFQVRNGRISI